MTSLIIQDLAISAGLDAGDMSAVRGGCPCPGPWPRA